VGGFGTFLQKAPEGFFTLTGGEYTLGFIMAFTLYHIVYIGGNWAFVQRYTSVKNERASRKVALLFAGMYAFSPFIWMLPPMIYRVMNPELNGLEAEGAYLMISRKILPAGLLGLMLAAMISATASTANTLLNLLAAVFTNDIYKKLFKPDASEKHAVAVGRSATVVFGLMTIGLALLVPKVGGLVNVVLSVGAITGGSLLAPVIWTLYSKRQTSLSVFVTSVVGLSVSSFFKFLSPFLLGFSLSRSGEMMLGIGLPLLVLAVFEWVIYGKKQDSPEYREYVRFRQSRHERDVLETEAEALSSASQNTFGIKAIAVGLLVTGLGIGILGAVADRNQGIVIAAGVIIALLAGPAWWLAKPEREGSSITNEIKEKVGVG
jgi:Na+/proline symporter